MNIDVVPVADVDAIWPKVSEGFKACIERTDTYYTLGELWTWCRCGTAFLIIAHDGANIVAASAWQFEGSNFVCLILAGENSAAWVPGLFETASVIARNGGCKSLRASGRVGLGPMLRRHLTGVKIIRHTYEIELEV